MNSNPSAARIKLLQDLAFFGGVTDDIVSLILEKSEEVMVEEGESFFREGNEGNSMFVLEEGKVAIIKHWKNKDYLLRHLDPGDCFGEMSLMDFMPRSASVFAVEKCVAIEVRSATLHEVYKVNPGQFTLIQMNMAREVCRRLRASDEMSFQRKVRAEIKNDRVDPSSIR